MAWFKVDDSFRDHPKVHAIPDNLRITAIGVWTVAGDWCAKYSTDGLIAASICANDARGLRQADRYWTVLVHVGLWHQTGHECSKCASVPEGHYLFHDWTDYQPSAAKVQADRRKTAAKVASWRARKGGKDPDVTGSVTELHPNTG